MARAPRPLFLARQSYRRRRLMDVGRVMPFLGVFLFLLPILWAGAASTSAGLIYLFTVWAILILGLICLARPIGRAEAESEPQPGGHRTGATAAPATAPAADRVPDRADITDRS